MVMCLPVELIRRWEWGWLCGCPCPAGQVLMGRVPTGAGASRAFSRLEHCLYSQLEPGAAPKTER